MAWDLCTVKTAEKPYLIRSVNLKIYSIEELCFFLYRNVCLIDDTVVCPELADWIREQLGLKSLARRLEEALERPDRDASFFILPIFSEIGYLTPDMQRYVKDELTRAQVRPQDENEKLKADYLVSCGRYSQAVSSYRRLLAGNRGAMSAPFYADVWNNLGCAMTRQFRFQEAADCFLSGYRISRSRELLRRYVSVLPLFLSPEQYAEKLRELDVDPVYAQQIQKMNAGLSAEVSRRCFSPAPQEEDTGVMVRRIGDEYRRSVER